MRRVLQILKAQDVRAVNVRSHFLENNHEIFESPMRPDRLPSVEPEQNLLESLLQENRIRLREGKSRCRMHRENAVDDPEQENDPEPDRKELQPVQKIEQMGEL